MEAKIVVYFYYLKSLKPILLNPFSKNKEIGDLDSEEDITILSSNTLTQEDNDYISQESFNEIDTSVNLWIQEKRYYPRLFISTLAFFVMYFFLSLVIRDPIPVFDELFGSIAFAIFVWYFFTKRDTKSSIANKKKLEIKRHVNTAEYKEINLLKKIEEYIYDIKSTDNLDIADALCLVEGELKKIDFIEEENLYLDNFITMLKKKMLFNDKFKYLYNKVVKVRDSGIKNEAVSSKLIEFGKEDKFSLLILTLLIVLENK